MKKYTNKYAKIGIALGVLLGSFLVVYAAMRLFYSQSVKSNLTKKKIFQFELESEMMPIEMGPGDVLEVTPVINNTASEPMYVFIEVETPFFDENPLYEYAVNNSWTLVESSLESSVYAYGGGELTAVMPGESTDPLTEQMKLIDMSNAEFSTVDDINITITGYGIDTEETSSNMKIAWAQCKELR